MGEAVFLDYDQAALDREYDNRAKAGDRLKEYFRFYASESLQLRTQVEHRVNLSYGPRGANTLDVFPGVGPGPAPVQIFIHGGYWKSLDAKDFSFVAAGFRAQGVTTFIIDYTLMPHVTLAEQVEECRRAITWVWQHAADFGGDPARIHLTGHSAGGHLAAMMLATDWPARGLPETMIRSATGISGLYDLEPVRLCYVNVELGLSEDDVRVLSPVRLDPLCHAPLYLPAGSLEGPEYLRQSSDLAEAWSPLGVPARFEAMQGHDHFSIVQELAYPDSPLSSSIADTMRRGEADPTAVRSA